MHAVANKRMPSSYVSLADTHPGCTPANDQHYPYARHRVRARAPGSTLYEEFHLFGTASYAANEFGIEVNAKRYRYIGKERDEETGLYHCGARYLAACLGRWTAADPIGLGDGGTRVEGEVPVTPETELQDHKDLRWVRAGRKEGVHRLAQWEFADAPPSAELEALLQRHGIPYVRWR